jgi:hypothetical protein
MPTYVGAGLHPDLKSEAGRTCSAISEIFFQNIFIRHASPLCSINGRTNSIGAIRDTKQLDQATTSIHRASSIVIELASSINLAELSGNRNMFNTRRRQIKRSK